MEQTTHRSQAGLQPGTEAGADLAASEPTFSSLRRIHEELSRLMQQLEQQLLAQAPEPALALLEQFSLGLRLRIAQEHVVLLPYFREYGQPRRSAADIGAYVEEHEMLLKLLSQLREALQALLPPPSPGATQIDATLKLSRFFRHMLQRHDERDGQLLMQLDQTACPDTRRRIVGLCLSEWRAHSELLPSAI